MKDYLNTDEKEYLISLFFLLDIAMLLDEGNFLSKEESTNLKKCITWGKKVLPSVQKRLNPSALRAFNNRCKESKIWIDYKVNIEEFAKSKQAEISAAYDNNKDYFRLVELIMHYKCQGCTLDHCKCELYHEFEDKLVPEFSGVKHVGNCKYSYEEFRKGGK